MLLIFIGGSERESNSIRAAGGGTDTCCRSPNYAASPGKECSASAGASLALSTHRDFGQ